MTFHQNSEAKPSLTYGTYTYHTRLHKAKGISRLIWHLGQPAGCSHPARLMMLERKIIRADDDPYTLHRSNSSNSCLLIALCGSSTVWVAVLGEEHSPVLRRYLAMAVYIERTDDRGLAASSLSSRERAREQCYSYPRLLRTIVLLYGKTIKQWLKNLGTRQSHPEVAALLLSTG